HVISGGNKITVFLKDGRSFTADLVGKSSSDDVALLKIDATGLTAAKIGDSSTLRVGDDTIVIGNPLGELQGTVTTGIISALEREIELDGTTFTVLQTDAAVNPGNSGGGMFDSNGELIGIVIAKTSETGVEGLGFVLPINSVKPVVEELMENGYVTGRPYIGLYSVDIDSYLLARMNNVEYMGVYVQSVDTDSPAELAGLRAVDLIQKIDGVAITEASQVTEIIQSKSIGDQVVFEIYRQGNYSETGENLTITVTVGENKG
ncbi:MAG TPA: trypsin-like peptidase domain-containing protein, partial [Clostridiales bacterium]|nr:trypsin-like peptidase domain-containing protein [Clostridiales bacterium]